jgi:protein arginine kinase
MWFRQISNDSDVVVSSRVRFARNIDGYKFTNMLNEKELEDIIILVKNSIDKSKYKVFKMQDIDEITRYSLIEQHLISKEFVDKTNCGLVLNDDNSIVVMINEEDHLRIQSFESGLNIDKCYDKLFEFTNDLENNITYSKSDKYGYLTSCPTNVGSGMRVSVMLHLPALKKIGLLAKIFEQITNVGMSVRGIYGENTVGAGDMYQISNQRTLGISNKDIIANIKIVIKNIIKQERKARGLLKDKSIDLEDEIYRAYGILKNARCISDDESLKLLSKLRLGVSISLISNLELQKVQSLMLDTQSYTLRTILKEDFTQEVEKIKRATYIREELG